MKFINWLFVSSADPEKTALTIKASFGYIIPIVIMISQIMGKHILPSDLEDAALWTTGILTALLQIFGFGRKIYYTFKKS